MSGKALRCSRLLKVGEESDEVNEKEEKRMPSMLHELLLRKALFWEEVVPCFGSTFQQ